MANSKISELNSATIINNADLLPIVQSAETKKATFSVLKSSLGDIIGSLNGLTANSQTFSTGNTGTDFNISSSGSVHTFNLPDASLTSRGLISTADFATFAGKQNQINGNGFVVANGTTISFDTNTYLTSAITSLNGVSFSSQLFATGNAGTDLNISSASNTHTINIPDASASVTRGLLTASDFTTFSSKQNQLNGTGFVKASGTTISYDNTTYLSSAITSLNSLSTSSQSFATGSTGSDFNISSSSSTHTFNIPSASAVNRGLLSSSDFSTFAGKQNQLNGTGFIKASGTTISYDNSTYLTSALIDINGLNSTSQFISAGTTGSDFNISSSGNTHTLNLPTASSTKRGALSTSDWVTFNSKQDVITLTTTGTSGASTLIGNTLNIPQYSGGGGGGSSTALNLQAAFATLGGSMVGMNISNIQLAYTTTLGFTSGLLYLTAIYIPTTTTINGAKWFVAVNGSITANNYNGIGLYSYSGGTLTLVASSATDSNIWSQGTGWKSKAFSSSYSASAGVYFIGTCSSWSASTTAPNLGAVTTAPSIAYYAMDFTNSARLVCSRTSITALPSSIVMSAVNNTSLSPTIILY